MDREITKFVKHCPQCINRREKETESNKENIQELILLPSRYPFHMIAINTIVMPETKTGYRNCVTIIDRFSRYAVVIPTQNIQSLTVIAAITNHWIYVLGVPDIMLTDNGTEFCSQAFEEFQRVM